MFVPTGRCIFDLVRCLTLLDGLAPEPEYGVARGHRPFFFVNISASENDNIYWNDNTNLVLNVRIAVRDSHAGILFCGSFRAKILADGRISSLRGDRRPDDEGFQCLGGLQRTLTQILHFVVLIPYRYGRSRVR